MDIQRDSHGELTVIESQYVVRLCRARITSLSDEQHRLSHLSDDYINTNARKAVGLEKEALTRAVAWLWRYIHDKV